MISSPEVRPVRTASEQRTFLTFPWRIYRDDPLWVPPLLPERARTIDPSRGVFFQRGEAEFFIAWRGKEPVGTICAAVDPPANAERNRRECIFGFFETINDLEVADALIATAAAWGRARGLNALFGPFNLDYEDGYGVLIEGRDRPPVILCGHTPPYYQTLLEGMDFLSARGDNLAYAWKVDLSTQQVQEVMAMAERVRKRKSYIIRTPDFAHLDDEVRRLHRLLNRALAHLPDHIPWQLESVRQMVEPFVHFADPELILFAELDGETVGWFPGIPNLNEALIHANGLRHPWDYVPLWLRLHRKPKCLAIKSVLVEPEHWGSGLAILFFAEMAARVARKGYEWVDLSLTSADNPRTPQLADRMGARLYKRYRVYRKSI